MSQSSILKNLIKKSRESINPYPGLRPFKTDEHPYFFGREKQIRVLIDLLKNHRFISVIGSSGSGKSSLVRAGLLPNIYKGLMSEDQGDWTICTFRPSNKPVDELVDELFKQAQKKKNNNQNTLNEDLEKDWLKQTILENSEGIKQAYRYLDINGRLLLVVDQFEEIFRYKDEAQDNGEAASAFVDRLIQASRQTDVEIYVCITMRSDFLGDCADFYNLPETISQGMYLVPRLERHELRKVITSPARLENATISPPLVDRLINELEGKQDQLPLLQHVLMRTFQIWKDRKEPDSLISIQDYLESGTMDRALSDHAYSILQKINDENIGEVLSNHQSESKSTIDFDNEYVDIAKKVFQCITQKSGQKGIRRPVTLQTICKTINHKQAKVIKVINYFRDENNSLLMPPKNKKATTVVDLTPDTVIDISHESLMRIWTRLKSWVEEEEVNAQKYRNLHADFLTHLEQIKSGGYNYLSGSKLNFTNKWLKSFKPTSEWANRYGGNLTQVQQYVKTSQHRRYTRYAITAGGIGLLAIASLIIYIGSNNYLRTFIGSYKNEILTSNFSKENDPTLVYHYSQKTYNSLEEANQTWGYTFFKIKNRLYDDVLSKIFNSGEREKISSDLIQEKATKNIIPAFNDGAFYKWKLRGIKDYTFSPNGNILITINEKDTLHRWNLEDNKLKPVGNYKLPTTSAIITNFGFSPDESHFFISYLNENKDASKFYIFQNDETMKKVSVAKSNTTFSWFSHFSYHGKYLFPDLINLDIKDIKTGDDALEATRIKNKYKNTYEISFYEEVTLVKAGSQIDDKNQAQYYLEFKDSTLQNAIGSKGFQDVAIHKKGEIVFVQSADSIQVWTTKPVKLIFEEKGKYKSDFSFPYLMLTPRKGKIYILNMSDPTLSNDKMIHSLLIRKNWHRHYNTPIFYKNKDTKSILFPDKSEEATYQIINLPIKKEDRQTGKKINIPHLKEYFNEDKHIAYLGKGKHFIEFSDNIKKINKDLKSDVNNRFKAYLNEQGELKIWDLKNYQPFLFGHPNHKFTAIGKQENQFLAYDKTGIYSWSEDQLQPLKEELDLQKFSPNASVLLGRMSKKNNLKLFSTDPSKAFTKEIATKFPITNFSIKEMNSRKNKNYLLSITTQKGDKNIIEIRSGENFIEKNKIELPFETAHTHFSKISDSLAVVNEDGIFYIPYPDQDIKINLFLDKDGKISPDSLNFKYMARQESVDLRKLGTQITSIQNFIHQTEDGDSIEYWLTGLAHGVVKVFSQKQKEPIRLSCGNSIITNIKGRDILKKIDDEFQYVPQIIATDGEMIYIHEYDIDSEEYQLMYKLKSKSVVQSIHFDNNENYLYTLGQNGLVKKWCIHHKEAIRLVDGPSSIYGKFSPLEEKE